MLLAAEGEQLTLPQTSPDGNSLYFGRIGKSGRKLVTRDLATGVERDIAAPPGAIGMEMSPDGSRIAMMVRDAAANRASIIVIPVAGGELQEVLAETPATSLINWVAWSSDGRNVLAMKATDLPTPGRETVMVSLSGATPRTIRLPKSVGGPIAVHPDGKRVAVTTIESRNEVWVLENFLPAAKAAQK